MRTPGKRREKVETGTVTLCGKNKEVRVPDVISYKGTPSRAWGKVGQGFIFFTREKAGKGGKRRDGVGQGNAEWRMQSAE